MNEQFQNPAGEPDHSEQDHQAELRQETLRWMPWQVFKPCDNINAKGGFCEHWNDIATRSECEECGNDITHQRD